MQFSTAVAAELSGATPRQVDHWARTGLVKPSGEEASGRGSRRRYTFEDLVALITVAELRAKGCPMSTVRKAVDRLRSDFPDEKDNAVLATMTLVTDGERVYLFQDPEQVVDVITRQSVWSIALGRLILDVREKVGRLPLEWEEKVTVRGKAYHLLVSSEPDVKGFAVQCRELPGALEQGETAAAAVANGKAAIESVLNFLSRRQRGTGRVKKAG